MTRPNIVLLVLDTVRADYFAEHALRLRGRADLNIETCRAASSWSVPSHASMLTGDLPSEHGVHTHDRDFGTLEESETFFSGLDGYERRGVSANAFCSPIYNFDQFFDEFTTVSPSCRYPDGMDIEEFIRSRESEGVSRFAEFARDAIQHDATLKTLANGGLLKLDDLLASLPVPKLLDDGGKIISRQLTSDLDASDEPTFLFANFMDAHGSHEHVRGYDRDFHSAPNTWSSRDFDGWRINQTGEIPEDLTDDVKYRRGLYRASIDYLDRVVASLVDDLQAATDRPTRIVVTADHGENLAERHEGPMMGHSSSLSEALLRVPLSIINAPNGAVEPSGWVSQLDLGTCLEQMAADEWGLPERDVVPSEVIGSGVGHPDENGEFWDRAIRTSVCGNEKMEWDSLEGIHALRVGQDIPYDITPGDNLGIPDWARGPFKTRITEAKRHAESTEEAIDVDAETEARLAELGYL